MASQVIVKGRRFRAQIQVWDFTEGFAEKGKPPLTFSVSILPASARKSTAFSRGTAIYYGESLREAVAIAKKHTAVIPTLPKSWERYAKV